MAPPLSPEIQQLLNQVFEPEYRSAATELLIDKCGDTLTLPLARDMSPEEINEWIRKMRFAVLYHSKGDINTLRKMIEIAYQDFRELPRWGAMLRQYKSWLRDGVLSEELPWWRRFFK